MAATSQKGWAFAARGQAEEGMALLRQGVVTRQTTGTSMRVPYFRARLAEILIALGQVQDAATLVEKALLTAEETNERWWEAELYRLKGELLMQQFHASRSTFHVKKSPESKVQSSESQNTDPRPLTSNPHSEAEACFLKAIEISQRQHAK